MNKDEFLKQLDGLLAYLPVEERREAMQYYVEYFEEAGPEREAEVIRELGSPREVAANIRQDLAGKGTASDGKDIQEKKKGTNGWKIAFIVLICIVVSPVVIPLGIGLAAALFGIIVALVCVLLALIIAAFAVVISCALAAALLFVIGIVKLLAAPVVGVMLIGASLVTCGVFLLTLLLCIKFCTVVLPELAKGIVYLVKLPFRKKEGAK